MGIIFLSRIRLTCDTKDQSCTQKTTNRHIKFMDIHFPPHIFPKHKVLYQSSIKKSLEIIGTENRISLWIQE